MAAMSAFFNEAMSGGGALILLLDKQLLAFSRQGLVGLRLRYRVDQGTPRLDPFVHTQAPSTVDKRLGFQIDDGHQKMDTKKENGHRKYWVGLNTMHFFYLESKLIFTSLGNAPLLQNVK